MKLTQLTLLLVSLVVAIPVRAQIATNATVETQNKEVEAAARERERRIRQEEAKALLKKKPVVYSGFLIDFARAENKKRQFSLRAARNPRTDYQNTAFDERSGRPRGYVLFRMEF